MEENWGSGHDPQVWLTEVPLDFWTLCLVILEPRRVDINKGIRFTDEFKQDADPSKMA